MRCITSCLAAALLCAAASGCGSSSDASPAANPTVVESLRASGAAAGGAEEVVAATGTGWGTLRGRFTLDGPPPNAGNLAAQVGPSDLAACGQHPIPNETLVVDSAGGIANVVVYARKVTRVHESAEELASQPAVFDQKECVFLSHVLPVQVGQTVLVKNSDPVAHNSNISPPGQNPFNPIIPGNGEVQYTFGKQQTEPVPVSCNIHSWMRAYIIPRKDPYVAVTTADGSFEIPNLPAGEEIELQVWHERGAGGKGALIAGAIKTQGRYKFQVEEDGEHVLEVQVPLSAFTQ